MTAPTSLRAVVFDFGRVLIRYEPKEITEAIVGGGDVPLLTDVLFSEETWGRLDAGTATNEEAAAIACRRLPERLHPAATAVYREWIHHLPRIPGMWELVEDLKAARQVSLYLLSNISAYFAEHADLFPVLTHFDRCFFSGVLRMVKPDADIFLHLLGECGLRPEETLFIDDNRENIAAAAALGMHTYLFDGDADRLASYLSPFLKLSNPPPGS